MGKAYSDIKYSILKLLFLSVIMFGTFITLENTIFAMEPVMRISGQNRYETCMKIMDKLYNGSKFNAVLITTGEDFPDALCGSVLAHKLQAPILFYSKDPLENKLLVSALKEKVNTTASVYILGGEGIIPKEFEETLSQSGFINSKRIAGADRFDTCDKIANEINPEQGGEIFITVGNDFPDALSVSNFAASCGYPIFLTEKEGLPSNIKETIKRLQPGKVYIIGGPDVITHKVEEELKTIKILGPLDVERIFGSDRYETSAKIVKRLRYRKCNISFACGRQFPDALAGSVLSANMKAPILLVDEGHTSLAYDCVKELNIKSRIIYGGLGAVSKPIEDQITWNMQEDYKEKSINDAAEMGEESVTRIEFGDGRGRTNKELVIEDKEKIKKIMNYINNYSVKKSEEPSLSLGWIHVATFYNDKKKIMQIVFGNPIEINNVYYDVVKGGLTVEEIDKILQSIDSQWKIP